MADFNPDEFLSSEPSNGSKEFDPDSFLGKDPTSYLGTKEERKKIQEDIHGSSNDIPASWKLYLKGLNYPFGLTTTAIANAANLLKNKSPISENTMTEAFKGNAKSPGALAQEVFPNQVGPVASKAIDLSSLFWGGKVDPLSLYGKTPQIASGMVDREAQNIYKSAIPEGNPKALEVGYNSNARSAKQLLQKVISGFRKEREPIESAVNESGVQMSPNSLTGTKAEIQRLREQGNPEALKVADSLEQRVNEIENTMFPKEAVPETQTPITKQSNILDVNGNPIQTNEMQTVAGVPAKPGANFTSVLAEKTAKNRKIGNAGYDPLVDSAQGTQSSKVLSNDLKNETERMANEASPGLGEDLSKLNANWGAMLGDRRLFMNKLKQQLRQRPITQVDAMLPFLMGGASGLTAFNQGHGLTADALLGGLAALATKKAVTKWNKPDTRLNTGINLKNSAQSGIWDEIAKRAILNSNQGQ